MTQLSKFDPASPSDGFQWVVFACHDEDNKIVMHGPFGTHTDAVAYVTDHGWPGDIFIAKIETKGTVGVKAYFDPIDI